MFGKGLKYLLITIFIGCLSSVLSAMEHTGIMKETETVYVMSSKDYYKLCAVLSDWMYNNDYLPSMLANDTREIKNKLKPEVREKIVSEMTLDEKLSIIKDDINLLEMKLLKLQAEVKRK